MSRKEEQQVSVAFVDNTDFFSVGDEAIKKWHRYYKLMQNYFRLQAEEYNMRK